MSALTEYDNVKIVRLIESERQFDGTASVMRPPQLGNTGIIVNVSVDLGVHRNFRFNEQWRMSLRWEMFNAFNHANFGTPNAAIGNANFGQISTTAPARIMQLALKLSF